MNIFSKKPVEDTYVIRRGISRKKDSPLWDLVLFICFILFVIWIFFFWSVHTGVGDFERGNYEQSLRKLSRISFLAPLDAGLHYKMALAHARLGHHEEVIEICRKVLAMQSATTPQFSSGLSRPSITEVYLGMTISYMALKRYSDAIVYAQLILTRSGDDAMTYKLLADAHYHRSFPVHDISGIRAARKFFDKAHEIDPSVLTPDDWKMIGDLRDDLNN